VFLYCHCITKEVSTVTWSYRTHNTTEIPKINSTKIVQTSLATLLYESKCWMLTTEQARRIETAQMLFVRMITDHKWIKNNWRWTRSNRYQYRKTLPKYEGTISPKDVAVGRMGYNAVFTCRQISTFRRNIMSAFSGLKTQYLSQKRWCVSKSSDGVTTQKNISILAAVIT
jgi:hypothetical protein